MQYLITSIEVIPTTASTTGEGVGCVEENIGTFTGQLNKFPPGVGSLEVVEMGEENDSSDVHSLSS